MKNLNLVAFVLFATAAPCAVVVLMSMPPDLLHAAIDPIVTLMADPLALVAVALVMVAFILAALAITAAIPIGSMESGDFIHTLYMDGHVDICPTTDDWVACGDFIIVRHPNGSIEEVEV